MIQNKLKSIEDTICWINQEEALFKFPQSSYPDVGDVSVSFNTVVKWRVVHLTWFDQLKFCFPFFVKLYPPVFSTIPPSLQAQGRRTRDCNKG